MILVLTKSVWNQYREDYFDNFFSSTNLVQKLKLETTLSCGTVRINRKGLSDKLMLDEKMNRGVHDFEFLPNGTSFFKWMQNKAVHLISNCYGSEQTTIKLKTKNGLSVSINCPTSVSNYNKYMGGVDHANRLRTLYNKEWKTRNWWRSLFFRLVDILFVNS